MGVLIVTATLDWTLLVYPGLHLPLVKGPAYDSLISQFTREYFQQSLGRQDVDARLTDIIRFFIDSWYVHFAYDNWVYVIDTFLPGTNVSIMS